MEEYVQDYHQINERILKIRMYIFAEPITIGGSTGNEWQWQCNPRKKVIILIGDFNSHVGNNDKDIIGRCGEDENKNDSGRCLVF